MDSAAALLYLARMPFAVTVDYPAMLVTSAWHGGIASSDLTAYIDAVWNDSRVRGYCELLDFREVVRVDVTSDDIHALAAYSRSHDSPAVPVGTALVAGDQLVYGLSRMFASVRALEPGDLREIRVFTELDAAYLWLRGFRTG